MSKSLFQINNEYLKAIHELENFCSDNETDCIPEDLHEDLKVSQQEFSAKLEAYHFVILELKGKLQAVKDHRLKMQAKEKIIANNINRLKTYVGQALEMFGEETKAGGFKHSTNLFSVTSKRSCKLFISEESIVPQKYKKEDIKTIVSLDKKAIKSDLLAGVEIEGAIIDDTTINVTFR